jgi:hypothetical protein
VGHPSEANTEDCDRLEVIVAVRPGRYFRIFHADRLTEKFRYLIGTEEDQA